METSLASGRARWIDLTRDLNPLADLLAAAFPNLDEEGKAALRQLRRMARNRRAQRMYQRAEIPGAPLYGFVWETEEGRLVGNVSLIPLRGRPKQYLIVNVAVHPAYRRRGIARALMRHTLAYAQRKRAAFLWLQVDHDNRGAIALYQNLGFQPRDVVTLWHAAPASAPAPLAPPAGLEIHTGWVRAREWAQQRAWLQATYPAERQWHLPCQHWEAVAPTWRGWLFRLLGAPRVGQWVARRAGEFLAAALWLPLPGQATEKVMLAAPPHLHADDLAALLAPIRHHARRPVRAELPQGFLTDGMLAAGFEAKRHLLWMKWSR